MGRFTWAVSSIDGASLRVPEECIHRLTEEKLHSNADWTESMRGVEVEGVHPRVCMLPHFKETAVIGLTDGVWGECLG
jgi:hypothetical protein